MPIARAILLTDGLNVFGDEGGRNCCARSQTHLVGPHPGPEEGNFRLPRFDRTSSSVLTGPGAFAWVGPLGLSMPLPSPFLSCARSVAFDTVAPPKGTMEFVCTPEVCLERAALAGSLVHRPRPPPTTSGVSRRRRRGGRTSEARGASGCPAPSPRAGSRPSTPRPSRVLQRRRR